MTCIVGIVRDGRVYLGGDSAASDGWAISSRAHPKVFVKGDWAFGYTTSFRMGQLIEHTFEPPRYHDGDDLMKYMVNEWVNALRQCLKNGGWAKKDSEHEVGGTFLVGFKGHLFKVEEDYQIAEHAMPFDAVGSGFAYALGALFAIHQFELALGESVEPTTILTRALDTAVALEAHVRAPYSIVATPEP